MLSHLSQHHKDGFADEFHPSSSSAFAPVNRQVVPRQKSFIVIRERRDEEKDLNLRHDKMNDSYSSPASRSDTASSRDTHSSSDMTTKRPARKSVDNNDR